MNNLLECGHGIYVPIKKGIHAFTPLCSRHTSTKMLSQETSNPAITFIMWVCQPLLTAKIKLGD